MCSSSPDASIPALSPEDRTLLVQVARNAIEYGLQHGTPLPLSLDAYPERLRAPRATFVTLHRHGQLRGCIGTLEAYQPLPADVAHNAHAAAFHDPRFAPLSAAELDGLRIHVSILNPAEPLHFHSEAELLAQLRPGSDGLILREGEHRATFLPTVWESLPEPRAFLQQLKRKAGLEPDYWSGTIQAWRYTTETFPD